MKVGQSYKYVPRKLYVYYSIIQSLQRILARPGIVDMCEKWREYKQNVPSGHLTDVYDGHLWHEWITYNDKPFLQMPGNLLLMLNVDWFQPFIHTQYSVEVIYLVIQNLPRAIRFKPENIVIVSTIPGPKEPDYNHMNNYLAPMVNDLISLWKGINITLPQSVLGSRLIRAALHIFRSTCNKKSVFFTGTMLHMVALNVSNNFQVHVHLLLTIQALTEIYGKHDPLHYIVL